MFESSGKCWYWSKPMIPFPRNRKYFKGFIKSAFGNFAEVFDQLGNAVVWQTLTWNNYRLV